MIIPAGWAPEVTRVADDVLRARQHEIRDGELDGKPWPATVYGSATNIVRRARAARARRGE